MSGNANSKTLTNLGWVVIVLIAFGAGYAALHFGWL